MFHPSPDSHRTIYFIVCRAALDPQVLRVHPAGPLHFPIGSPLLAPPPFSIAQIFFSLSSVEDPLSRRVDRVLGLNGLWKTLPSRLSTYYLGPPPPGYCGPGRFFPFSHTVLKIRRYHLLHSLFHLKPTMRAPVRTLSARFFSKAFPATFDPPPLNSPSRLLFTFSRPKLPQPGFPSFPPPPVFSTFSPPNRRKTSLL